MATAVQDKVTRLSLRKDRKKDQKWGRVGNKARGFRTRIYRFPAEISQAFGKETRSNGEMETNSSRVVGLRRTLAAAGGLDKYGEDQRKPSQARLQPENGSSNCGRGDRSAARYKLP